MSKKTYWFSDLGTLWYPLLTPICIFVYGKCSRKFFNTFLFLFSNKCLQSGLEFTKCLSEFSKRGTPLSDWFFRSSLIWVGTVCLGILAGDWCLNFRTSTRPLVMSGYQKITFLFLNQSICCGYSKEPSQWDYSFEHPKHMLKIMGKKIFISLRWNFLFI